MSPGETINWDFTAFLKHLESYTIPLRIHHTLEITCAQTGTFIQILNSNWKTKFKSTYKFKLITHQQLIQLPLCLF